MFVVTVVSYMSVYGNYIARLELDAMLWGLFLRMTILF